MARPKDRNLSPSHLPPLQDTTSQEPTFPGPRVQASTLQGQRILVTRPRQVAASFCASLESFGAEVKCIPLLSTRPALSEEAVLRWSSRLSDFSWLLVTSANAVRFFLAPLAFEILSLRHKTPSYGQIACVGQASAQSLQKAGLSADLLPQTSDALGLIDALRQRTSLRGLRFLWPTSNLALPTLAEGLQNEGAIVESVTAYTTGADPAVFEELRTLLDDGWPTLVTVASPSAVESLLPFLSPPTAPSFRFAAIGPTTAHALHEVGWSAFVVASAPSAEAFALSIATAFP